MIAKEPIPDPAGNSNLFMWEPGYSHELPHQVPWALFDELKRLGGKNYWYCGGLLLVAFVGREKALAALGEAARKPLDQF